MSRSQWSHAESIKARKIWAKYVGQNDLSNRIGQTAGIDPKTGRIWFGESIQDVVLKRKAEGFSSPLFFQRVGSEAYYRKGSHR